MRKSCLFIALSLLYVATYSQWEYFGSSADFKDQLQKAKDDTTRLRLNVRLSNIYVFSYPDTALQYAHEGLQLAQSVNSQKWMAYNNLCIGQCFLVIGNYTKGIEIGLKQIPVFEELQDTVGIIVGNFIASWGYRDEDESSKALVYAKTALYFSESSKNIAFTSIALEHIAAEFKGLHALDSALLYARRGLAVRGFGSDGDSWSGDIRTLADIFSELKQSDSALFYYKMTIGPSLRLGVFVDAFDAYLGIARVYQNMGKIDSSIYFAHKALTEFSSLQYPKGRFLAASVLAENYQTYKESDSTLKYLRLSLLFKDSLYSQEKIKAFQAISFNEQMRQQELQQQRTEFKNRTRTYVFIGGLLVLLGTAGFLYRSNLQKQKAKRKIEKAYSELKTTQAQLIQSEKMASLGELTAGIAHEIQNPLNFVNNFSEVNKELIEELRGERRKVEGLRSMEAEEDILNSMEQNLHKVLQHGQRADAIVKSMLQHSRANSGQKELIDVNALADEYLRLSYHGMQAKEKSFIAAIQTDFDAAVGKVNINPQDIGRVLLNLYNNAFYAVADRKKTSANGYEPTVMVSTKKNGVKVEIRVCDNGSGIPEKIKDKIFQPFFTTKPTGQGTGLGLSLSYDIVKAHGGALKVETKESEGLPAEQAGTEFVVQLPV